VCYNHLDPPPLAPPPPIYTTPATSNRWQGIHTEENNRYTKLGRRRKEVEVKRKRDFFVNKKEIEKRQSKRSR
jgi:hypothetical protein